jgi:hypothetical protein
MTPPVSNAVQGGFFVAAVLSGLIFGALSLVFTDITDGLGCLLGGFCLSMWFLTLKKNGLITSTAGRAIFIACMSVGGYSLSFSHYTRTYGLIVCISFAGATIAILGIDCFSCAGLKEFWLYLWSKFFLGPTDFTSAHCSRLKCRYVPPQHQYLPHDPRHQSGASRYRNFLRIRYHVPAQAMEACQRTP